jgi:hypothetical protein
MKRLRMTKSNVVILLFAALFLFVLPPLTPYIDIPKLGKIGLSGMQMFYGVLSLEIVLAVYIFGVGVLSRSQPQPISAGYPPQPGSIPAPTVQPGPTPPAQKSTPPVTPQGGH